MTFGEYLSLLNRKKKTILSVVIIFTLLAAIITFFMPFKYSAQTKLLVMQNNTQGLDPYNVSRSNEYVTSVLAQVVNSNSFFNDALNAGFNINREYFTDNVDKQIKIWNNTVKAKSINDAGIINITVYHTDKNQTDQIIRAINNTLKSNNTSYHSLGDKVAIKVINQPIVSSKPIKPNIPLNVALGFISGLIFALSFIYLFPEEEYNLSLVPFKQYNKKEKTNELIRESGNYYNATKWQDQNQFQYNQISNKTNYVVREHMPRQQAPGFEMKQEPILNQNSNNIRKSDDIDSEDIVSRGSMANIFGGHNLS